MFFLRYMRQLNARDGAARRFSVLDFDTRHRVILRLLQRCKFVACFRNFSRQFVYRFTLFFLSLLQRDFFQTISRHLFFLEILLISLESVYQETFINKTVLECFFSKLIFESLLVQKILIILNDRQMVQNYSDLNSINKKWNKLSSISYFNVLFYHYMTKIKYNIQKIQSIISKRTYIKNKFFL